MTVRIEDFDSEPAGHSPSLRTQLVQRGLTGRHIVLKVKISTSCPVICMTTYLPEANQELRERGAEFFW